MYGIYFIDPNSADARLQSRCSPPTLCSQAPRDLARGKMGRPTPRFHNPESYLPRVHNTIIMVQAMEPPTFIAVLGGVDTDRGVE